jgi:hypothetical protein
MQPPELVAVALQQARESLEEVVGVVQNDDILELILVSFVLENRYLIIIDVNRSKTFHVKL